MKSSNGKPSRATNGRPRKSAPQVAANGGGHPPDVDEHALASFEAARDVLEAEGLAEHREMDELVTADFVPDPEEIQVSVGGPHNLEAPPVGIITDTEEEPGPKGPLLKRAARSFFSALDLRGIGKAGGYGAWPLVALTLLAVADSFNATAFSQSLPEIQRAHEYNLRELISALVYISLAGILLTGPIGYLGDRWKRTKMSAIGGIITSAGAILTPLVSSKPLLVASRAVGVQGQVLSAPVQFSLLSDYYPLEERGRVFGFNTIGETFATLVAPLAVGFIGTAWGWRAPFYIIGTIGILVSLLLFRLKEPVRGFHERKARGADDEVARREEEPPTWGEAWRAARAIRTLRRISYSFIFSRLASLGFGILLYVNVLPNVHNLDLLGRGYVLSAEAAAGVLGLMAGGPLVSRLLVRNPGRVTLVNGAAHAIGSLCVIGIAFTRSLPVAVFFICLWGFVDFLILPAQLAVSSAVVPPRLRGLARSTLAYWSLPATLVGLPVISFLAAEYGSRAGLVALAPVGVIGGLIYMTAGPFVEFDIRSAQAAAMAAEEWRRAKGAGAAKLLVIRDLDVHYETVQVVFNVDLDVDEGEMVALLGTNGAGKSTVLRAVSGTQPATGGAIVFDGRDITHLPPHEVARLGVVQMPGGRGIFPGLSVKENLALAGWIYGDEPGYDEQVETVFEYFPILRERLDVAAGTLSGGEQQMLGLAQAFLSRPRLLMIDELSMGLAPAVVGQLIEIVKAIHARGTTVIIIEQSVNIALSICKRAIFMEKGEVRFDGPTEDLMRRPDILRAVFLKGASAAGKSLRITAANEADVRRRPEDAGVILSVEGITKSYGGVTAVNDLSFDLHEGEILGLIGPNGAGKTSAIEIVSGFTVPDSGKITYESKDITSASPDERARMGLIRRFQDARLFPALTVAETLAIAFEKEYDTRSVFLEGIQAPQARIAESRVRRRAEQLIELMELGDYRDKFVGELSTGSRRVVDLACVLAAEPKVLLLDEPSTGMAQREAEALVPLLLRIRRETGCSMLIVEHDIPMLSAVADEILAMVLGRPVVRGQPNEVLEHPQVVDAYLGTNQEAIARSGA